MRRVALLEKTRTPYRHPLFEYIGQYVDLTVYYAGDAGSHRRWEVQDTGTNYTQRDLNTVSLGPLVLMPRLYRALEEGEYDEIVASTSPSMLLNSQIARTYCARTGTDLTIWTEHIKTEWRNQRFHPKLLKPSGVATEFSFHSRLMRRLFSLPLDTIQSRLYREANRVIAFSELAAKAAIVDGATDEMLTTVPQWYPPEILPDADTAISSTDSFRVFFVGSHIDRKGIKTLLEVATHYDRSEDVDFVIAGDGPLKKVVADAATKNLHISAPGYVDEKRKVAEFEAADLLVVPSRHEPWGVVVNEAYIHGTPAVVTEACGSRMIVSDDLVVPAMDSDSLYETIERVRHSKSEVPTQPDRETMATPLIEPAGTR